MTTAPAPTREQARDAAEIFASEPATRAVAFWSAHTGETFTWPQATADNRPARVLARIGRYAFPEMVDGSLVIVHRPRG